MTPEVQEHYKKAAERLVDKQRDEIDNDGTLTDSEKMRAHQAALFMAMAVKQACSVKVARITIEHAKALLDTFEEALATKPKPTQTTTTNVK